MGLSYTKKNWGDTASPLHIPLDTTELKAPSQEHLEKLVDKK